MFFKQFSPNPVYKLFQTNWLLAHKSSELEKNDIISLDIFSCK